MSDAPYEPCCAAMRTQLEHRCERHPDPFECPDTLVVYSACFDEYGLVVHDGGTSSVRIACCPWCGARLPESRRDEWFDRLAVLGYDDPLGRADLPPEFRSSAWFRDLADPGP